MKVDETLGTVMAGFMGRSRSEQVPMNLLVTTTSAEGNRFIIFSDGEAPHTELLTSREEAENARPTAQVELSAVDLEALVDGTALPQELYLAGRLRCAGDPQQIQAWCTLFPLNAFD